MDQSEARNPSVESPFAALRRWAGLYSELAKARLSALVVCTTAVGFVLASRGDLDWLTLLWTVMGTALAAACANALNQQIETSRDARMKRTRGRPLPTRRMSGRHALIAAGVWGVAGLGMLTWGANGLTAALGASNIAIYVLLYTPAKSRSTFNTLIGAVVGAIPPMMGCTAATGHIGAVGWALAAVLFVWQVPHFLSLAWLYRDDYRDGGFRMLPVVDPDGRLTGRVVVIYCLALLPIAVVVTLVGGTGWIYAFGSVVLGAWMLKLAIQLNRVRTDQQARRVFLASVMYLPLLLGLMLIDQGGPAPRVPDMASEPTEQHLSTGALPQSDVDPRT